MTTGERATEPTTGRAAKAAGAAAPETPDDGQQAPLDLRLVLPAASAWAAAVVALRASSTVTAAGSLLAVALAVTLLTVAARRRRTATVEPSATIATIGGRSAGAVRDSGPAGRAATTIAAALLCAAAAASVAGLHAAEARRGPLPALAVARAHVSMRAMVTKDPRATRPRVRGSAQAPPAILVEAVATQVRTGHDTVRIHTPVLLIVSERLRQRGTAGAADQRPSRPTVLHDPPVGAAPDPARSTKEPATGGRSSPWSRLLPSTEVTVVGELAPPSRDSDRIAAVLHARDAGPAKVTKRPSALQRAAGRLRDGLRTATDGLRGDARALLPGLVVGDTSRVSTELDTAFRATDLTHLLAVSGSNLSIILLLFTGPLPSAMRAERRGIAARLGLPLRLTVLLGGMVTLAFVVVCRPDPSVLRAAACGLISLLAIASGRRRSLLPILAAAVLALLLYDPWLARSYGFLLSVSATGALLTLAPRWAAGLRRMGLSPRAAELLAAAAAAQAACAPVIVMLASRVSLVSVPCNLLVEPAVWPATVLGFAALAAAPVWQPAATSLAWLAGWPVRWIAAVARTGADLPGAGIDWPGGVGGAVLLAVALCAAVVVCRLLRRRPLLSVFCVLALLLAVIRPAPLARIVTGWPPAGWRLVACDVGQGDALVLATGGGKALVVDAGPEPRAVDGCLRELGVRQVPLVILTHYHADHVAGLPGVLHGRSVGAIETTTLREPAGQVAAVRRTATTAHVPLREVQPGERRRVGDVSWEVLWPIAPTAPMASVAGQGPNNASITLLVRAAGVTLALLGDLEPPAQQALLAARPEMARVDVVKVAHHGSAYQEPRLLQRLRPRVALISVGTDNPYGHPAARTLTALRSEGARVLRTDTDGAVAVVPAGATAGGPTLTAVKKKRTTARAVRSRRVPSRSRTPRHRRPVRPEAPRDREGGVRGNGGCRGDHRRRFARSGRRRWRAPRHGVAVRWTRHLVREPRASERPAICPLDIPHTWGGAMGRRHGTRERGHAP